MRAESPGRRAERRPDIEEVLKARGYRRVLDLTAPEGAGRSFEGTGALVLDRVNGVAYVALSDRANLGLAQEWVQQVGYRVCMSSGG